MQKENMQKENMQNENMEDKNMEDKNMEKEKNVSSSKELLDKKTKKLMEEACVRREAAKFGFFLEDKEWKEYTDEDSYEIKKGYVVRTFYYHPLFWDNCGGVVFFPSLEKAHEFLASTVDSVIHMPRKE